MSKVLQQITITYVPEQDRLLLRASVQDDGEYRLWLTRRYTALLAGVLHDQLNKGGSLYEQAAHRVTLGMLKGPASDPSRPAPDPGLPPGEPGLLGYRIILSKTPAGALALQLLSEQGEGLIMHLKTSMLYLLYHLLEQGIARTDWQLSLPQLGSTAVH